MSRKLFLQIVALIGIYLVLYVVVLEVRDARVSSRMEAQRHQMEKESRDRLGNLTY